MEFAFYGVYILWSLHSYGAYILWSLHSMELTFYGAYILWKCNDGITRDTPYQDFPRSSVGKESICSAGDLDSWVRKILWRRKWQPTPVFLPGESHGQRSLAGYSPWGYKSWTQLSD